MPILSVFAPLLKSRFFGFYVNGVTLAGGIIGAAAHGSPFSNVCSLSGRRGAAPYKMQSTLFCAIIFPINLGDLFPRPEKRGKPMIKILFVCHGTTLISPEVPSKTT